MIKKLFLTISSAVFAVCPAFAESAECPDCVIDRGETSADCSSPTIGSAGPGGTVNYVAVYQEDECPITLDKNGGSVDSVPNQLIAVYDAGAYLNRDGNSQPDNLMSTSANGLTDYSVGGTGGALPTGASVTVTYNFVRKSIANVAGSVFVIISAGAIVAGIAFGLIYHTKLKTDD